MPQLAPAVTEQVLQYFQVSGAALDKAAAFEKQAAETRAQVESLIPETVDALIAHGRIDLTQKSAAVAALQDHSHCVQMILKLASHRNEQERAAAAQLGAPSGGVPVITNKQASVSTLRPSDIALFQGLGLPVPTA